MQKIAICLLSSFHLITCHAASAQTSVLVCEGETSSIINGFSGPDRINVTLTKVGGKVVKAILETDTEYTTTRVEIKPNIYSQLINEKDKIILRVENEGRNFDFVIHNTGAYTRNRRMGISNGQCTARTKVF